MRGSVCRSDVKALYSSCACIPVVASANPQVGLVQIISGEGADFSTKFSR